MTNYELVRKWMHDGGQDVPNSPLDAGRLEFLYNDLIREEFNELQEEFRLGLDYNNEIKEVLDLIWVCYGKLAAMGLDADYLMRLLYENNHAKLEAKEEDENGKLVVPKDVKTKLKQDMYTAIDDYVAFAEQLGRD